MSFITGIISAVIEWLLEKVATIVIDDYKIYETEQQVKAQASSDEAQVESAVTSEQKTSAAAQLGRDTFSN